MVEKIYFFAVGVIISFWIEDSMGLDLQSPAFKQGETISKQYTCDGRDTSPPLVWKDIPVGTSSLVLIMDDPDAPNGTWNHWVVYNIPSTLTALTENLQVLPAGTFIGKNSWGKNVYAGPCPPNGEHRYFFTLYAIDTTLPIHADATKQQIMAAINGHVLASAQLVAKYQRSK